MATRDFTYMRRLAARRAKAARLQAQRAAPTSRKIITMQDLYQHDPEVPNLFDPDPDDATYGYLNRWERDNDR